MKAQIVFFLLCSNMVWCHVDVHISTQTVEFKIIWVNFRLTETEISSKKAVSLYKERANDTVNDWKNEGKSKGNGFRFEITGNSK